MAKNLYQRFLRSRFRKPVAIVLIITGLLAFVTPLTPGSWLALIGLKLLGWRFLLDRPYTRFKKKVADKKSDMIYTNNMTIQEQIKGDLKDAMRAKDRTRVTTLRGMLAAFINELTAQGKKPDAEAGDELALTALKRAIKQRREAIEQYEKGGRAELAKEEKKELEILETYLPEQMSEEEIHKIAEAKKEELGITDMSDMGRLIGAVVKETNGQADGAVVKNIVSKLLS